MLPRHRRLMVVSVTNMAGRPQHLACIAFTVVFLGMGRQGYAQLEYRLSAGSSLGVSDISGAASATTAGLQPDVFVMARAGAQLSYAGRKVHSLAAYAFAATWWLRGSESSSLSHTLVLSSDIETSAATHTTLGGSAALSQLSLVDSVASADPLTVGARPAGTMQFVAFDAHEAFVWQLNARWRLDQMLAGGFFHPIGQNLGIAQSESLTHSLAITRLWGRDQVGLRTRLGAIKTGQATPVGGTVIPGREGEFAEALVGWRHDFTPTWSSDLAAGAFVIALSGSDTVVTGAGSAALSYRYIGRELDLRAARTVEPNVFLGAALERDVVSLSVVFPLGRWDALHLNALADLEHDSTAGAPGGPTPTTNILVVSAGATYQPGNMFKYRLEYTFRDQLASAAVAGITSFPSFRRQVVMFTIDVHYPPGI